MERVFISGVSGYIGGKLASRLIERGDVREVVGIDVAGPRTLSPKLRFFKRDVRDPIDDILKEHAIDTVVHLAWVMPAALSSPNLAPLMADPTSVLAMVKA